MVKEINKENKRYYECKKCGLLYKDKKWAGKCDEWCKENYSCNIEITKHAIKAS